MKELDKIFQEATTTTKQMLNRSSLIKRFKLTVKEFEKELIKFMKREKPYFIGVINSRRKGIEKREHWHMKGNEPYIRGRYIKKDGKNHGICNEYLIDGSYTIEHWENGKRISFKWRSISDQYAEECAKVLGKSDIVYSLFFKEEFKSAKIPIYFAWRDFLDELIKLKEAKRLNRKQLGWIRKNVRDWAYFTIPFQDYYMFVFGGSRKRDKKKYVKNIVKQCHGELILIFWRWIFHQKISGC